MNQADVIRKGLRRAAEGNHGDGDVRAVAVSLADLADDCPDDELLATLESSIESMGEALQMTLNWIRGKTPGLSYFECRDSTTSN